MRQRATMAMGMAMAAAMLFAAACGGGDSNPTPTPAPSSTPRPVASSTPARTPTVAASPTPAASPSPPAGTPTVAATPGSPIATAQPCDARMALDGRSLVPTQSAMVDAHVWQLCVGGAAAGSSEKYLFRSDDGGATWRLVSQTTLGNPPAIAGVGNLPNGNAVSALLFLDATHGWIGLTSPGANLFRSPDGGVTWIEVDAIPPGAAVQSIAFADLIHGTVTTSEGTWTTADGGATWTKTA